MHITMCRSWYVLSTDLKRSMVVAPVYCAINTAAHDVMNWVMETSDGRGIAVMTILLSRSMDAEQNV